MDSPGRLIGTPLYEQLFELTIESGQKIGYGLLVGFATEDGLYRHWAFRMALLDDHPTIFLERRVRVRLAVPSASGLEELLQNH